MEATKEEELIILTLPKDTVYILDTSWLIHRAYHVAEKSSVSAVYIFSQMILRLIEKLRPEYLIAALDCKSSKEYRRDIYPDYKKKSEKPKEFLEQVKLCDEVLRVMAVQMVVMPGFEADDIMATFAKSLSRDGRHVCLISQDKDLLQCVTNSVVMYDSVKDRILDPTRVKQLKGFYPFQSIDVQALTGDATDGVPGIPGIGDKTAARLVEQCGSALAVFFEDRLNELTPGLRKKLEGYKDQVLVARHLVTLVDDLHCSAQPLEPFVVNDVWCESVAALFKKLKFNRSAIGRVYLARKGGDE